MPQASRAAIIALFALLYAISIAVTFVKFQRNLAEGRRPPLPPMRHHRSPQPVPLTVDKGPAAVPVRTDGREEPASDAVIQDSVVLDNSQSMKLWGERQNGEASPIKKPQVTFDGGIPHRVRPGRFPRRGTPEFAAKCGWTLRPPSSPLRNCTILVRPREGGNEGVSWWSMQVLNGYVQARQSGCRLMLDYGPGVDVRRVMEPLTALPIGHGDEEGLYDWSVPAGFECREKERCFWERVTMAGSHIDRRFLISPPKYRFAYTAQPKDRKCTHCIYPDSATKLQAALPGYDIESGPACAFANLFWPALTAVEYEPRLFSDILPTVHDPDALVMSVYIRTGWTDDVAKHEEAQQKENVTAQDGEPTEADYYRWSTHHMLECAMSAESYFANSTSYSRVVWMIVTDSPSVKQWAYELLEGRGDKFNAEASRKFLSRSSGVNRTIVVTSSRGVHTRTRRDPSTADFAEALVDWYLIGESDAVVANQLSFGYTASLRSARPVFKFGTLEDCSKRKALMQERPEH